MSIKDTQIEICIEEAADTAGIRDAGADRIELCRELWCGGLTPSDEQVLLAVQDAPPGGVRILVREREQGFALTQDEVEHLVAQIEHLRDLTENAQVPVGFVIGSITDEEGGQVDLVAAQQFLEAAGGRPVVFHRAFDEVADQQAALAELMSLGFTGILTTGGNGVADTSALSNLVEQAGNDLAIIASGGVRAHNVRQVLEESGAPDVHMRAPLEGSTYTDMALVRDIVSRVRGS